MQSEIGLMLPTTAPGPDSKDQAEASQKEPGTFSSRSKKLVFAEADKLREPPKNILSSCLRRIQEIWSCSLRSRSLICHT